MKPHTFSLQAVRAWFTRPSHFVPSLVAGTAALAGGVIAAALSVVAPVTAPVAVPCMVGLVEAGLLLLLSAERSAPSRQRTTGDVAGIAPALG